MLPKYLSSEVRLMVEYLLLCQMELNLYTSLRICVNFYIVSYYYLERHPSCSSVWRETIGCCRRNQLLQENTKVIRYLEFTVLIFNSYRWLKIINQSIDQIIDRSLVKTNTTVALDISKRRKCVSFKAVCCVWINLYAVYCILLTKVRWVSVAWL